MTSAMLTLTAVRTAMSARYGFERDELSLCPVWGYVDQPPLTPLLVRLAGDLSNSTEPALLRRPAAGLVIGGQLRTARQVFRSGVLATRLQNRPAVDNDEEGEPVATCRQPVHDRATLWTRLSTATDVAGVRLGLARPVTPPQSPARRQPPGTVHCRRGIWAATTGPRRFAVSEGSCAGPRRVAGASAGAVRR